LQQKKQQNYENKSVPEQRVQNPFSHAGAVSAHPERQFPARSEEVMMKLRLALTATVLMLAAPAMADDETKKNRHWLPGGQNWQPAEDTYRRGDYGRDRDHDGDHDRKDHHPDNNRDWHRNDSRWNHVSGWNNNYRYGVDRNLLGRWAFVNFDLNCDGRLDRYEYGLSHRAFYDLADRNGDGYISDKDWRKFIDRYGYRNDIAWRYGYVRSNPRYGYNDGWRR
jgi:hypothetical protein